MASTRPAFPAHSENSWSPMCVSIHRPGSPTRRSGGSLSGGDLPRRRDQRLAHPGMGEHGGRQPLPPGLGSQPDCLRAGTQVPAVQIHPLLLQPPTVWLPGDTRRHWNQATAHQKQLKRSRDRSTEKENI